MIEPTGGSHVDNLETQALPVLSCSLVNFDHQHAAPAAPFRLSELPKDDEHGPLELPEVGFMVKQLMVYGIPIESCC